MSLQGGAASVAAASGGDLPPGHLGLSPEDGLGGDGLLPERVQRAAAGANARPRAAQGAAPRP